MPSSKVTGALLLIASIVIIVVYNVALWLPPLSSEASIFLLKLTDSIIVIAVLAILAWIGYTLITTPPPKPIEEIEKELEKELKSITQKSQQEAGQATSGS
ncbi:MAG: transcriptional regulator [Acidilobus sp.]|jgi:predicted DNA-binding transcriptional regulator|nr:transcriptional regulator [Acidilobus sp.]MCG2889549.1 transcriptional regulator [Acidilobus sp.]MCG2891104.1 transcriptional regulator [Acidilobus sp.]NAZ32271.1 transcriptional regulator [Acidilobus sp.]